MGSKNGHYRGPSKCGIYVANILFFNGFSESQLLCLKRSPFSCVGKREIGFSSSRQKLIGRDLGLPQNEFFTIPRDLSSFFKHVPHVYSKRRQKVGYKTITW